MSLIDRIRPETLPFAGYVLSESGLALANDIARLGGAPGGSVWRGGLSAAARLPVQTPIARNLLVEMGTEDLETACDGVRALVRLGSRVVVIGTAEDLATYRALRAAGAEEYFSLPGKAEDAIAAFRSPAAPVEPTPRGATIVGVVGCSGGVGASALAQNFAWLAASASAARRVAFIDADLQFGTAAHDMNVDATRGFLDALANPARVDRTFLDSSMTEIATGLWLYARTARNASEAARLEPGLAPLLRQMAAHFDVIVVDIPRALVVADPTLAQTLDKLVAVLTPGYAGISGHARVLQALNEDAPDLDVLSVLAQLRRDADLKPTEISKATGHPVVAVLPADPPGMIKAQKLGRPIADCLRRSRYSRQVAAIWGKILPERSPQPGFWRRLTGGKPR